VEGFLHSVNYGSANTGQGCSVGHGVGFTMPVNAVLPRLTEIAQQKKSKPNRLAETNCMLLIQSDFVTRAGCILYLCSLSPDRGVMISKYDSTMVHDCLCNTGIGESHTARLYPHKLIQEP